MTVDITYRRGPWWLRRILQIHSPSAHATSAPCPACGHGWRAP